MPGAQIAIDQDRPGPSVSTGTPGYARNDLWLGRVVRPRSVNTHSSYLWAFLDKPPGSTAVLTDTALQTCAFTPDIAGSYRLQLIVSGGGLGNTQILVAACTFDTDGVEVNNGWRFPALGETPEEVNFAGQTRGWDETIRNILMDLVDVGTIYDDGVLAGKRPKINFIGAGVSAVDNPGQGRMDVTVLGLTVQDESGALGTFPTMNFVGPGITAADEGGGVVSVTVDGLSVQDEGVPLGTFPYMNFAGAGVTATDAGGGVTTVTIPVSVALVDAAVEAEAVIRIAADLAVSASIFYEIPLIVTERSTTSTAFTRVGARPVDLSRYPTIAGYTRHVRFRANVQKTAGATSGTVQLYDVTNNVLVTGTDLTTTSTANEEKDSGDLTVGSSAGDIRSDVTAHYEVQLKVTGGTLNVDATLITNARLVVYYT